LATQSLWGRALWGRSGHCGAGQGTVGQGHCGAGHCGAGPCRAGHCGAGHCGAVWSDGGVCGPVPCPDCSLGAISIGVWCVAWLSSRCCVSCVWVLWVVMGRYQEAGSAPGALPSPRDLPLAVHTATLSIRGRAAGVGSAVPQAGSGARGTLGGLDSPPAAVGAAQPGVVAHDVSGASHPSLRHQASVSGMAPASVQKAGVGAGLEGQEEVGEEEEEEGDFEYVEVEVEEEEDEVEVPGQEPVAGQP
jgi:hypothetical protein